MGRVHIFSPTCRTHLNKTHPAWAPCCKWYNRVYQFKYFGATDEGKLYLIQGVKCTCFGSKNNFSWISHPELTNLAEMEVAFLTPATVCFQMVNLEIYKATSRATLKTFGCPVPTGTRPTQFLFV